MRAFPLLLACSLALPGTLHPQDIVLERATLGTDSLFGRGIIEVAANGLSVRVHLDRPAHVLAMGFKVNYVPTVIEPRGRLSSETRRGTRWLDLFPLGGLVTAPTSMPTGRASGSPSTSIVSGGRNAADRNVSTAREIQARTMGSNVALVIASEEPWDKAALEAILPVQGDLDPMWSARSFAEAAGSSRTRPWVAWIVRW